MRQLTFAPAPVSVFAHETPNDRRNVKSAFFFFSFIPLRIAIICRMAVL